MAIRENDIVKVVHYQSPFAGKLAEVREVIGNSAYVEFNDRWGTTWEGQIIDLTWLEWVYTPSPRDDEGGANEDTDQY